ncbi:MAG: ABC transporter ATP-binding protein [Limnohabitans sp.]|jgi:branched-chain amino acid transport system ATP-binding protein|nr:ABC transporter ATP-binding protein [Limnohabitans sp.]
MTASALAIENIEVVYNHSVQALRGLSIEVPAGQIVALLGSNGAGKSTTLKAASGILPFEKGELASGQIRFYGEDIAGRAAHTLARQGMAHVREGRHIFVDLTVEENLIAAGNALKGRADAVADIEQVFHYFPRLQERRKQVAGYLSGGEQQMLAIGRAIVGKPKLILLDEPSLGLAPLVVQDIFAIIERINREQNVAILVVEQNAHVALGVAHYAYIMENGRIVIDGPKEKLLKDPDVQRFYLGAGEEGQSHASFRDIKHYKRRKRWLS